MKTLLGLLFILSAPAGTGKTTLVEKLVQQNPKVIESISYTTRTPRPGEVDGVHYYFVDKPTFEAKIAQGEFLEHAEYCGNYYGTSKIWVEEQQKQGKHVILTIETKGAQSLKGKTDATYIFLLPPSLEILKERLSKRGTESEDVINKRLALANEELKAAPLYDYAVVNDNIDTATQELACIISAEEHRIQRLLKDPARPELLKNAQ